MCTLPIRLIRSTEPLDRMKYLNRMQIIALNSQMSTTVSIMRSVHITFDLMRIRHIKIYVMNNMCFIWCSTADNGDLADKYLT
jgi:hypothetical protein